MQAKLAIRSFPWGSLDRVPRNTARGLRAARLRLSTIVDLDLVPRSLSELVGGTIEFSLPNGTVPARERFAEITLACAGLTLSIGVAPDLATALLSRVLGRSLAALHHDSKLDPALLGALGALAVEVLRRSAREPVALVAEPLALAQSSITFDLTVRVDGKPHGATVRVSDPGPSGPETRVALGELGDIEVSLPVVIALSLATRAELEALRPGAAWLPGAGAFTDARGVGRGMLAAPTGERGASVDLTADGRIVLRHDAIEIAADEANSTEDMAEANGDDTLTDAVLEAPVVVRVELGSVSLPASEWAKLRPGDVIETGQRVAEPVVLRIAGRAVARGELVDVDGELGVRIRELVKG
jgi:type III secretion system YscQ/HrcQ family protein